MVDIAVVRLGQLVVFHPSILETALPARIIIIGRWASQHTKTRPSPTLSLMWNNCDISSLLDTGESHTNLLFAVCGGEDYPVPTCVIVLNSVDGPVQSKSREKERE